MPPKPKFTKRQLVEAAYSIIKKEGAERLTARAVAARLDTTPTPIFTYFEGMDELKETVYIKAKKECVKYLSEARNFKPAFAEFVLRFVHFAYKEANVFRFLFFSGDFNDKRESFRKELVAPIFDSIREEYGLSEKESMDLLHQVLIHATGIASVEIALGETLSDDEILHSLRDMTLGLVAVAKMRKGSLSKELRQRIEQTDYTLPKKI